MRICATKTLFDYEVGMLKLHQSFEYRGETIAWGKVGTGEPIVLVHGTPFSSQVWRRIVPWLARTRTVYFHDLLGYGQSTKRAGQDVSLGVQNGAFAALLSYWNLELPEVVAHDFGGATSLRSHYLNGVQYRRLTLIDPVAIAPWGSPFVQHVRHHEQAFVELPAYAHEAMLAAYLQGAAHHPLSSEAQAIYQKPWKGAEGQAAFYRQIAQMDQRFTDEVETRYSPTPFPVRIIWGEQDQWIPIAQGEKLALMLGAIELVRVPNAGHLVQEDAPEAIASLLAAS